MFLNEWIPFNLHCRFNECGIKLLIRINNYLWINLVSTRHLRPWCAKHKMSVDESSQKIGQSMYLQGTVMHQFNVGKCIEKCKMFKKSDLCKTTTLSSLCFLTYPNDFMFFFFFFMRQTLGRQTMAKCMRNAWSQESKFRWPSFNLFRRNWSRDANLNFLF